ncbi:MAG: hypothetical protein CVT98_07845 [Bacteroidetes bacterium HGW-Bacteroidetes-15]|nr:MAG: hypothetical protein CVT98_07845 [Bacteroidetes bacterium HGW-Bacteroidetes-15]
MMKSLKRNVNGTYSWVINVEALSKNLTQLMDSIFPYPSFKQIDVPTLFIKGEKSNYIHSGGVHELPGFFSNYTIAEVPNAGHWLHAENPGSFMNILESFLNSTQRES